jgi:hypothetical protein
VRFPDAEPPSLRASDASETTSFSFLDRSFSFGVSLGGGRASLDSRAAAFSFSILLAASARSLASHGGVRRQRCLRRQTTASATARMATKQLPATGDDMYERMGVRGGRGSVKGVGPDAVRGAGSISHRGYNGWD